MSAFGKRSSRRSWKSGGSAGGGVRQPRDVRERPLALHPEQRRVDRRDAREDGDLLLVEPLQRLGREDERALERERRAEPHRHQQLVEPVVEGERQDAEDPVVRAQAQVLRDAPGREHHVRVRQHHALRVPGAPGGVDQRREVDRDRARVGGSGLGRVDRLLEVAHALVGRRRAPTERTLLSVRLRLDRRRPVAREAGLGEQDARLAVVEDERELVGLRLRVDDHEDAAGEQRPEDRDAARRGVVHEDRDAIAALEPLLLEGVREPCRLVEELRVREARLLGHDRRLVAEVVRGDEQAVVEQALMARAGERGDGLGQRTASGRRGSDWTVAPTTTRVGTGGGSKSGIRDQLLVQEHRRDRADERHLVGLAGAVGVRLELRDDALDGLRPEDPGGAQALGAQQLADVLGRVLADEDAADRRPVRTLAARVDLLGQERADGAAQRVLLLEPAQPQPVGQRGGELRHAVVEEREAALDRVAHQHPVALRVQQVALEEGLDLDVLRLAERAEALEPVGQPRDQARGRVVGGAGALDDAGVEHAERARGVREADAVAVERVVRVGQPAPVEARDEGARALEVAAR